MVGVPGSGKSFFAEHFSETFSAPLVSWDALRAELFNEPTYSKDEDMIVKRVADHVLSRLLKTSATVLYEGDMTTKVARTAIAKEVRQAGYQPLFVWVQTDEATAKRRALKNGVPEDVFVRSSKHFTPFNDTDPYVVISGKHTYASQLKIILRRLSSARAAAANEQPARVKEATPNRRVRIQ